MESDKETIKALADAVYWQSWGDAFGWELCGLNRRNSASFRIYYDNGKKYILQEINALALKDIDEWMDKNCDGG